MAFTAKYDANGQITAGPVSDGQTWSGITPASRFYAEVMSLTNNGANIAPYVEPEAPLGDLSPKEFWRGALAIDITEASILSDIDGMAGLTDEQKEDLKIAVSKATSFSRNDPDLVLMLNYKGYDAAQIDALWQWVLSQRAVLEAQF